MNTPKFFLKLTRHNFSYPLIFFIQESAGKSNLLCSIVSLFPSGSVWLIVRVILVKFLIAL